MDLSPGIKQFLEKVHDPDQRPLVMGIINVTPDSFYAPTSAPDALSMARRFIAEGADILDIGGESTRPGAAYVDAETERERVWPLITAIRRESDIPISIDTRKLEVARDAVAAGADCINDISALREEGMGHFIAEHSLPVILMHMQGSPENMQDDPYYADVLSEVRDFLQERVDYAQSIGIPRERIILDPGIGFGKSLAHNLQLLNNLETIVEMGLPVLIGHSRKSFIGRMLGTATQGRRVKERLYGSLAVAADSYIRGARIFRVHDVAETRDLLEVMYGIRFAV